MLAGKARPRRGTPPGLPFAVHHHMLAQAGIHLIENAKLDEMAADRVWTSCTLMLPLREKGAAGSALRPGGDRRAALKELDENERQADHRRQPQQGAQPGMPAR